MTDEGNATAFVRVDHCTDTCLDVRGALRGTRFEAIERVREAILAIRSLYEVAIAAGMSLRHDRGSHLISAPSRTSFGPSGSPPSPSFARLPKGNSCVERFIRSLK